MRYRSANRPTRMMESCFLALDRQYVRYNQSFPFTTMNIADKVTN